MKMEIPSLLPDDELEALGTVSPADREDAGRMWRQDAPQAAKGILEAEEDGE